MQNIPLIIESHPPEYNGYEFITLIRYNDENNLCVIDNSNSKQIIAYVLDLCGPHQINEDNFISITEDWWNSGNKNNYPLSIQFSKMGLAQDMSKILRTYPIDYVSRIIGNLPHYKMSGSYKIKKRKRKALPKGVEFVDKRKLYQQISNRSD